MSNQAREGERVELKIIITHGKTDVYFWHEGQKYIMINLDGGSEDYFIGDNPIPESLVSWACLEVIEDSPEGHKSSRIAFGANGIMPKSRAILEQLAQRANAAIRSGQNTTIDITDELQSIGWDIYFSNTPTPRRNPRL